MVPAKKPSLARDCCRRRQQSIDCVKNKALTIFSHSPHFTALKPKTIAK